MAIYAIIETGGKQYRVTPGQTLDVERLTITEEMALELDRVLLVSDDNQQVLIGSPLVAGALVLATIVTEHQAPKVVGMKYKRKTRYKRKFGHRQVLTRITIEDIRLPGQGPVEAQTAEADSAGEVAPVRPAPRRRAATIQQE